MVTPASKSSPGAARTGTLGRDDKRPANQRIALGRAGRVGCHRHRHDGQRAAEIIGHVVNHFARRRVGIDDSRPEHDRLFGHALERIQLLLLVAVAAESGHRAQDRKFRDDQVHDLGGLNPERAFAEEEAERIGQLVIAHLQDALIDCEDRDPRRPVGLVADAQRFARFRDGGCLQIDLQAPLFDVRRERNDAVAERAGENFLRIERPNQRDVDVAAAFEAVRHADALNAAGRVRFEPAGARRPCRARS